MANVTFSSPVMPKDVTVYAVAGHRGTLLAIAREHKIPIPFDCQDGECGSCLVEVEHLPGSNRMSIALTEKEKELLRQLGKITKQEIMDAEVNDMPPRYRLACQCFVRDEDVLVTFEGDETLPVKGPSLSIAASIYKGGVSIKTLDEFLNFSAEVEQDAAVHYEDLAASMKSHGNDEVGELFLRLAAYSRQHYEQVKERMVANKVTFDLPQRTLWPDNVTPGDSMPWAGDANLSRLDALKAALQGERRGYEFYYAVANTSASPEIATAAKEFVKEEAEHVEILKQWIAREEAEARRAASGQAPA
ncbi:MAG TPA: 2Fe-2S iron-sulfur cluster-binding protein [Acidiferrobacter sp.]|nr:2Fe-2S iron-sulfur cluster-binding protein [Acidiferrobacter sp.]